MDITRFKQIAGDPLLTRAELENLKGNALKKGNVEFAKIAESILTLRFPTNTKHGGGGATPTTATFKSYSKDFDSGKDAYIWLLQQFLEYRKDAFEKYIELHKRKGARSMGSRFARTPDDLFPKNSNRKGNIAYYVALPFGWYADTNLNHKDKFETLMQLSHVCGLEYGADWDFQVVGATKELLEHQKDVVRARKLLDGF